jgi:hypothetical protein
MGKQRKSTPATQVMAGLGGRRGVNTCDAGDGRLDDGAGPISRVTGVTRGMEVKYADAGSHGVVGSRRGGVTRRWIENKTRSSAGRRYIQAGLRLPD